MQHENKIVKACIMHVDKKSKTPFTAVNIILSHMSHSLVKLFHIGRSDLHAKEGVITGFKKAVDVGTPIIKELTKKLEIMQIVQSG